MFLEKIQVGMLGVNCYILGDSEEIIIIDPGAEAERICRFIRDKQLKVKYIVLTHCHFDHILAADDLCRMCGGEIVALVQEKENLLSPEVNLTNRFCRGAIAQDADVWLMEGDCIYSGNYKFQAILTPGHTSGSMCLYCESEKILLSGDTLFYESIGRTDFATGSSRDISESIHKKLYILPDETKVLPGHGEITSIGHEKTNNLYV